jgi:hypothetical protein
MNLSAVAIRMFACSKRIVNTGMGAPARWAIVLLAIVLFSWESNGKYGREPTPPLPDTDILLARDPDAGPYAPEQVHVSYAGPGSVAVSWTTWPVVRPSEGTSLGRDLSMLDVPDSHMHVQSDRKKRRRTSCDDMLEMDLGSSIQWGYASGELTHEEHGAFSCYSTVAYDSGAIHRVKIGIEGGPLSPSATIFYRVGDAKQDVWSEELSFETAPLAGHFPYRLGLVGDLGQTKHSIQTLEHLSANQPDSVVLVGDLSYADGYQPRWDTWARLVTDHTSRLVYMFLPGNHEIEPSKDKYGTVDFLAYMKRFEMPFEHSGSPSPLYYSYDVAGAHVVMLCSYSDYEEGSEQYEWLVKDLAKVSRTTTPWVLVGMHAPWYNSNHNHNGEGERMRKAMEPILYQHGVNFVISGHVHAYERSHPVHDFRRDGCGPMYINVGDGGNREGLDHDYYSKPDWSAVRDPSYGHGVLDLIDEKTARFSWFRNSDGLAEASDVVEIKRTNYNCGRD